MIRINLKYFPIVIVLFLLVYVLTYFHCNNIYLVTLSAFLILNGIICFIISLISNYKMTNKWKVFNDTIRSFKPSYFYSFIVLLFIIFSLDLFFSDTLDCLLRGILNASLFIYMTAILLLDRKF